VALISEIPIRRTIRRHQLREIVPLADSTIYEMEQRGEFPQRFALTPRCTSVASPVPDAPVGPSFCGHVANRASGARSPRVTFS
jgi:Prophage CP4-57 regulatory protein (AlpA)